MATYQRSDVAFPGTAASIFQLDWEDALLQNHSLFVNLVLDRDSGTQMDLDGGDGTIIRLFGSWDVDGISNITLSGSITGIVRLSSGEQVLETINGFSNSFGVSFNLFTRVLTTNLFAPIDIMGGADDVFGGMLNDVLMGRSGNDNIVGFGGTDLLFGNAGIDNLNGGSGNDSLFGEGGKDTLRGSTGNDTLKGGNGSDKLLGGTGNDKLSGGIGNDKLNGGAGNDTLTGNADVDRFQFYNALGSTNVDSVTDFNGTQDLFLLDNAIFTAIGAVGAFAVGDARFYFAAGATAAHDANDRIVYNTSTGALYYDADGTGGTAAIRFATLTNLAPLEASDIAVV